MTVPADVGPRLGELDERLLALDPDLEELFAEVDEILRSEMANLTRTRRRRIPRRWPRTLRVVVVAGLGPMRDRRPPPGPATQRGPPPPNASMA
ncbi:hypothetical protein [Nocardia otitidiscaviarum]|uniref:hypothetical protein n=1 Tax=Nocardia otitidiscaviarum TaxID=1823 RepID=UPI00245399E4|nr:hypothetical protein [Nocardia otitidiscaviarum]